MTYTTVDEMITAYGDDLYDELNVSSGSDISANATLLEAIAAAEAMVNSYLRMRYTLPLETVTADIRDAAIAIAHYKLIPKARQDLANSNDRVLYKDALDYLGALSMGRALLPITEGETIDFVLPAAMTLGSAVLDEDLQGASNKTWFANY